MHDTRNGKTETEEGQEVNSDWTRVSKSKPCPVCKKPDYCGVSADGAFCICMRVDQGAMKQTKNGGWLHRLKDTPLPPVRPAMRPPPPKRPLLDMAAYHAALRKRWTISDLDRHAAALGIGMDGLGKLAPAWDGSADALAFPMRNGEGVVTGIRLRNSEGKKWAVRGGSDGLFYDPDQSPCEDLVVCEGPTDTAAALSLMLDAVGRPSCQGAVEELKALIRRLRVRSLTVVADNDVPREKPDGTIYAPGMDGARKLIAELKRMARIVVPPAKDFRQWYQAGATNDQFNQLAKSATWRLG